MEEVGEGGLLEAATASPPSLPVGEVSLEQSEALAGAVGLEALAARASVLPALPAHRLAASSVLFMLLLLLAVAVLVLAVRRPVLRRQALSNVSDEWAPINVDHRDTPDLHPSSRTSAPPELQPSSYSRLLQPPPPRSSAPPPPATSGCLPRRRQQRPSFS